MEALRIIMDEHQSLGAILHAIRYMLKEIEAGRLEPDFALFHAMVHYLDAYPEKKHHPKENTYLFEPLKKHIAPTPALLTHLEQEHAASESRIQILIHALANYTAHPTTGLPAFASAFEQFATFYRNHMLSEEREIFPLIRQHFTPEDWAYANAGLQSDTDPMENTQAASTHAEFQHIFSRLVAAAPSPIGLGAGPYTRNH